VSKLNRVFIKHGKVLVSQILSEVSRGAHFLAFKHAREFATLSRRYYSQRKVMFQKLFATFYNHFSVY